MNFRYKKVEDSRECVAFIHPGSEALVVKSVGGCVLFDPYSQEVRTAQEYCWEEWLNQTTQKFYTGDEVTIYL